MRTVLMALLALAVATVAGNSCASADRSIFFAVGAKISILETEETSGFENPYGVFGGVVFSEYIGLRVDYDWLKADNIDVTNLVISAVGIIPTGGPGIPMGAPYVRAGIVLSDLDSDAVGAPEYDSETGFEVAVGYHMSPFIPGVMMMAEVGYRFLEFDHATGPDISLNGYFISFGVLFMF